MDEFFDGGSLLDFMMLQTMMHGEKDNPTDKKAQKLALIFKKYNMPVFKGLALLLEVLQVFQEEGGGKDV